MSKKRSFGLFMKRYGAYCVAGFLVVALSLTIILASGNGNTAPASTSAENPVKSVEAVPAKVLTFTLPMNGATITKDYSSAELYFNDTLNRWEFHNGIDLTSSNLAVFAIADGVVSDVYESYADGYVVVLTHGSGLTSVYSSLAENVLVSVGDEVEKSTQIGTAGNTAATEYADGVHLHLAMFENDKNIDPANYLDLENK